MHQKLVPDHFLILVNNPKQSLHARNSFKIRYFERGLSKKPKKFNFRTLKNSVRPAESGKCGKKREKYTNWNI